MNRFFNISKSTGRKLSATVLVLVASLLGAGSAWADNIGFYETKDNYVWDVQFGYNGTNYVQHGDRSTYSSDANLGILTTDLYLDGFYAWCWGGSTTRYVKMYSALKYNSGSFTSFSEEYSQKWDDIGDQQISTPSFSGTKKLYALSDLSAGDYQYKYYLVIVPSGSDAVADGQGYCSNNGSNMGVYFTIPGFNDASSLIEFLVPKWGKGEAKGYFNHYGTAPTMQNCTFLFDGNNKDKFSVTAINAKYVTVRYSSDGKEAVGSTVTSNLTITDSHGKTVKIPFTVTIENNISTTVTIADDPVVENGPMVTLSGYLKYSGCDNTFMNYGFVYSTDNNTPTKDNSVVNISSETTLPAKSTFSKTFFKDDAGNALSTNTTYYYRAYAKNGKGEYFYSSKVGTFTTGSACQVTVGDTIYYTIDNTQVEDPCVLRFQTLDAAIADAKTTHAWIDAGNIVKVPIVFEVAAGTYGNDDNKTRIGSLKNINTTSISNYVPTPTLPGKKLIIRAADAKNKPIFKGGLSLMGARNVLLKNLKITRSTNESSHAGSAVEFGHYNSDSESNAIAPGTFANTNCEMIGCEIEATGFNCIHATACERLTFDDCVFNLTGSGSDSNDKYWGASVKLMSCNNVQFTRNNLRGSHATTLFLQHIQNSVIMNNVFWNDNLFTENVAFVRPVVFNTEVTKHNIQNLGVYYNTFYLKDNAKNSYNVDYLRFGGPKQTGNEKYYKADLIEFKWNNCYSYDDQISARNDDNTAFLGVTLPENNFANNNFWSKGDSHPNDTEIQSNLAFGSSTKHINVENQVCQSTAYDPDDLVLKGSELNIGDKPTSDVSGLEVANNTYADRFNTVIRSDGGGWTYGAFQMVNSTEVDTIIWVGDASDAWDLRTNWATTSGKRLNCTNVFATNLHVIIPDAAKLSNVPTIPIWASKDRGEYKGEYVAAGLKNDFNATSKFASTITIKEGGAIKGVENLYGDGTLRYDVADNMFTAIRSEWILVGGVIKPFKNGKNGDVRNVQSGDFYIADQKPHVYMQHFKRKENSIIPGIPFTSLTEEVATNSAFGIYIPDQYGKGFKMPAEDYFTYIEPNASMVGDGTVPKTFTFNGRFANEAALPVYNIGVTDTWYFVNNSYPANLNVAKLLAENSTMGLNAKVYSYTDKSWNDVIASESEEAAVYVKPNNGFVLYATTSTGDVYTNQALYGNGTTIYYKRSSVDTYAKIKVKNTADASASTLNVRYEAQSLPKAFSYNESTPEIYVIDGENKYSTYGTTDLTEIIPLGLRNKQNSGKITVQFTLTEVGGFESVVLEDRLMNQTYDLTDGEAPYFSGIAPGDCEGRFFLNINYANENEPIVPTDAKESADADASIDIYANDNVITVSASDGVKIEKIELCDLAGRVFDIPVQTDNFSQNMINSSAGVYTVKVTSDLGVSVRKVIIK